MWDIRERTASQRFAHPPTRTTMRCAPVPSWRPTNGARRTARGSVACQSVSGGRELVSPSACRRQVRDRAARLELLMLVKLTPVNERAPPSPGCAERWWGSVPTVSRRGGRKPPSHHLGREMRGAALCTGTQEDSCLSWSSPVRRFPMVAGREDRVRCCRGPTSRVDRCCGVLFDAPAGGVQSLPVLPTGRRRDAQGARHVVRGFPGGRVVMQACCRSGTSGESHADGACRDGHRGEPA